MALQKNQKEVIEKVLDIENLEIVDCLGEAAVVGLGVGLVTSLFYDFKTACKAGAIAGGFHLATKIITAEMFLDMLRPAEMHALKRVIGNATSSTISPHIFSEILVIVKQLAEEHGLSLVKAMAD